MKYAPTFFLCFFFLFERSEFLNCDSNFHNRNLTRFQARFSCFELSTIPFYKMVCKCALSLIVLLYHSILAVAIHMRSEEHTSELQSRFDLVSRLLLEKKNNIICL